MEHIIVKVLSGEERSYHVFACTDGWHIYGNNLIVELDDERSYLFPLVRDNQYVLSLYPVLQEG